MRLPELVLPAGRCRQADRPARAAARWHPAPAIRPSTTTSCSPTTWPRRRPGADRSSGHPVIPLTFRVVPADVFVSLNGDPARSLFTRRPVVPRGPKGRRAVARPGRAGAGRRRLAGVARGWSPLCRLSAPVRVAWPAVLAVIVVLGAACGGGTKAQPGTRSAGGATQLRIVATTVLSGRMRDLTVASPALGETVKVRLLLPVHYQARPGVRRPVLYLLHGCCDTYQSWTRSTGVEALTAHSDVLVVMPDGGKAGFYSDWLSGPRWETFHLVELRRILEREYRASTVMAVA